MVPSRTLPRQLALLALMGATGATLATPPSFAGSARAKVPVQAEGTQRITLDFVEAELTDVAKALSVQSGVNIAVTTQAKGKITLRLRNTTLEDALKFISRLAGVDYRRFEDTYIIGTHDELRNMAAKAGVTESWTPKHLKGDQVSTLVRAAVPYVSVQPMPNGKSVLLTGAADDLAAARRLLADADVPGAGGVAETGVVRDNKVTKIYPLKYLHPSTAKYMLDEANKKAEGKPEGMFGDLLVVVGPEPFSPTPANFSPLSIETRSTFSTQTVTSNKDANGMGSSNGQTKSRTLVLTGPADQVDGAIQLLRSLDTAAPQVMIEAKLVDISPEKFRELGLEYDYGPAGVPTFRFNEGPVDANGNVDTGGSSLKFGRFFRTPFNLDITLRALETQRVAKLLANPRISVVDSEDASIFIGDLLRYRVLSSVTAAGSTFTIETVPVGVALLVRPRIHDDGNITLKVHPVVSTVTALIGEERIPQTASREADSTIRMRDGETIAIGGLLREEEVNTMRAVPLLSKLPILGELFKSRSTNKRKSEVTVFLTARILK
jgi:type II secretory pathway component GspD/PulD (secretin)